MALAKWARTEEPKPGSLKTRRDVDEWILPPINKYDTLHTVLDRYYFKVHLPTQSVMYVIFLINLNPVMLSFNRVFESFHRDIIRLQRDMSAST